MSLVDMNGNQIGEQKLSAYEEQQMRKEYEAAIKKQREARKKQVEVMKEELEYMETLLNLEATRKEFQGEDEYLASHVRVQITQMLDTLKLPAEIEQKILEHFGWAETTPKEEVKTEIQITE